MQCFPFIKPKNKKHTLPVTRLWGALWPPNMSHFRAWEFFIIVIQYQGSSITVISIKHVNNNFAFANQQTWELKVAYSLPKCEFTQCPHFRTSPSFVGTCHILETCDLATATDRAPFSLISSLILTYQIVWGEKRIVNMLLNLPQR